MKWSPAPVKPGLFTASREEEQIATLRRLLRDLPRPASAATSVSGDRTGFPAVPTSLTSANKANKPPLSSGVAVPVEAGRLLKNKPRRLVLRGRFEGDACSTHRDAAEAQTEAKKPGAMRVKMRRACLTLGTRVSSAELGIWHVENEALRLGPSPWVCLCPLIQF